jgi:hypothetical protein
MSGNSVGIGSWYNWQPFDYINEESDLPQGHKDQVRIINLLAEDEKHCGKDDGILLLQSYLFEHTGQLHSSVEQ